MKKLLVIILLGFSLTGCKTGTVEMPVEIHPYVCVDGWQYDMLSHPIMDDFGAQLTCD